MPLACDPTATQRIVLSGDKDKSPQPAFVYRFLSYRQWIELSRFQENLKTCDAEESIALQETWLKKGLVGWTYITDPETGSPMAFDPERILDVIGMVEAQEILGQRLMSNLPSLEDKKKLSSPSASDSEKPVPAVEDRPAAPTSQAPPSH